MTGWEMQPWLGRERTMGALDEALTASSADQLEIFMTSRIGHHTRFAQDRIHQAQSIVECQVMVRAVVGVGSARVAVSDLRSARRAVADATRMAAKRDAEAATSAPHGVAGPTEIDDTGNTDGLWHDATMAWDEGERSAQAGRVMDLARRAGGVATGVLTSASTELAVVTTGGCRAYATATEAGFALTVRVGEASSYQADVSRDASRLDVDRRSAAAVDQAARTGRLVPVPDGVHDVVFGALATSELIGFVPDFGFTAGALAAGTGLVATHAGDLIAAPEVTVADDAHGDVGLPWPFDMEGTGKRRVELISAGRVGAVISDLSSAGATGGRSTGHAHIAREQSPAPAAANLVMAPGALSEDDLIAEVERGLYIQRLWYNRLVDAEAGTIVGTSRDACFLIEDGKLTAGLSGGRFTESVLGALARTDGIGDRLISRSLPNVWNGCASAPAIRVRGFRFGSRPDEGQSSPVLSTSKQGA